MLRKAVATGSALGREAKRYIESGTLVPDDVVVGLVADRLAQDDTVRGFVLEGFPRTVAQAHALERLLNETGHALDRVVELRVSEPELLRRLTARRVGGDAGEPCRRTDDDERTARKRLDAYASQAAPLRQYYAARGLLDTVSGEGPVDDVRHAVRERVREPR